MDMLIFLQENVLVAGRLELEELRSQAVDAGLHLDLHVFDLVRSRH
jgi:hypothetical protein